MNDVQAMLDNATVKVDTLESSLGEARAAEAGKLRDAVAQLGDSESAPSTAAAVEGIDDDAAFAQSQMFIGGAERL